MNNEQEEPEINNDSEEVNENVKPKFDLQHYLEPDFDISNLPTLDNVLQAESPALLDQAQPNLDQPEPAPRHSTRIRRRYPRFYKNDFQTSFSDE